MVENSKASDVILTESDLREIEQGLSQIQAEGDRYPEVFKPFADE
jgi:hypothetical protein